MLKPPRLTISPRGAMNTFADDEVSLDWQQEVNKFIQASLADKKQQEAAPNSAKTMQESNLPRATLTRRGVLEISVSASHDTSKKSARKAIDCNNNTSRGFKQLTELTKACSTLTIADVHEAAASYWEHKKQNRFRELEKHHS